MTLFCKFSATRPLTSKKFDDTEQIWHLLCHRFLSLIKAMWPKIFKKSVFVILLYALFTFMNTLKTEFIILWTSVQIWWNIVVGLCFTRNHSPCLLRWSCLQTSEGQRRSKFHLVRLENSETPSTSSVWPSDHREDHRSCARPFYSLVQIIPKALHSD